MMVGRRSFPFGKVTFQGRTVKLQLGKMNIETTGIRNIPSKTHNTIKDMWFGGAISIGGIIN